MNANAPVGGVASSPPTTPRRDQAGLGSADAVLNADDPQFPHAYEISKKSARANFAKLMAKAQDNNFVVKNHSRPEAAIISIDKYAIIDWLKEIDFEDAFLQMSCERLTKEEFKQRMRELCDPPSADVAPGGK